MAVLQWLCSVRFKTVPSPVYEHSLPCGWLVAHAQVAEKVGKKLMLAFANRVRPEVLEN